MHRDLSIPENGGCCFSVGWYWNQADQAAAEEYGSSALIPSTLMASVYPMVDMAGLSEVSLDRSLEASRNHREAERRRRERIKSHLDRLRNLLACDSKVDKATLLAKAVEHVRYLKQRTAEIGEMEHFPTETDEVSVYPTNVPTANGRWRSIIKASLCCEDRSDLLPEIIETVKSLRLKTLKAEIATMGGRVRNVLVVAGEEGGEEQNSGVAAFLRDALMAVIMDRQAGPVPEKTSKRSPTLDETSQLG